jgi:hypothetical protein
VNAGRNAAAVVGDPDPTVGLQGHVNAVAVTRQSLVDSVVDDLLDQVVKAPLAGGPDVHPGTLPDRLEPLEDRDRGGIVGRQVCRVDRDGFGCLDAGLVGLG